MYGLWSVSSPQICVFQQIHVRPQIRVLSSNLQLSYYLIEATDIWHVYSSTYLNSLFMVIFYLWNWPLTPRSNYWLIWKYCILLISFSSYTLNFWHVARLNQVNLPYAITCDLDLLLQGQVIYNLKNKIFYFLTCFSMYAGLLHQ